MHKLLFFFQGAVRKEGTKSGLVRSGQGIFSLDKLGAILGQCLWREYLSLAGLLSLLLFLVFPQPFSGGMSSSSSILNALGDGAGSLLLGPRGPLLLHLLLSQEADLRGLHHQAYSPFGFY